MIQVAPQDKGDRTFFYCDGTIVTDNGIFFIMFEQLFRKTEHFFSLVGSRGEIFFSLCWNNCSSFKKKKLFRVKQMFHPKTIQMYLSEVLS